MAAAVCPPQCAFWKRSVVLGRGEMAIATDVGLLACFLACLLAGQCAEKL